MVILLSIEGIPYVKSAKILIANLVQVKSGHKTSLYSPQWRYESRATLPTRFAGFRIAKQPIFPQNKFGMSETSC